MRELVFRTKRIEEINIAGLSRQEKFDKFNELAKDENNYCYFDGDMAHRSNKIIVHRGEWIDKEVEEK